MGVDGMVDWIGSHRLPGKRPFSTSDLQDSNPRPLDIEWAEPKALEHVTLLSVVESWSSETDVVEPSSLNTGLSERSASGTPKSRASLPTMGSKSDKPVLQPGGDEGLLHGTKQAQARIACSEGIEQTLPGVTRHIAHHMIRGTRSSLTRFRYAAQSSRTTSALTSLQ